MRKVIILFALFGVGLLSCNEDSSNEQNLQDFDAVWYEVERTYPFLDMKGIDWDSLYTVYLPTAQKAYGDEIDLVILNLLEELHDSHIIFYTKGGFPRRPYISPRFLKDFNAFNHENTRKFFNSELKLALENTIEYENITDDIGYMKMSEMYLTFREGYETSEFDRALKYFTGTKALIIDVRHNTGGWAFFYIRRFISETIEMYQYSKKEREKDFITPKGITYKKPIVILINGCTMSAGEDFAYFLKDLPNVTLVGDTTAGMAGNLEDDPFVLPSGKRILIPTSYPSIDGLSYEDIGVIPDIYVKQTSEDAEAGGDKQLSYSIEYLKETIQ